MRIAFVWYFNRASEIMPNWRDGLKTALEIIGKNNQVIWYIDEKLPQPYEQYDAYLIWGDINCPAIQIISQYKGKKGLLLSSENNILNNLRTLSMLNTIYCESTPIYESIRRLGFRAIKAFGTDTEYFIPDKKVKKDIEFFYPATFSPWKKQSTVSKLGNKLLCVGTIQPDGQKEYQSCKDYGVNIQVGYFPVADIRNFYRRSKDVVIPAIHGSERTVLEAMSMDILPIVNQDNIKAHSYIKEYNNSEFKSPRDFVVKNYSAQIYANAILKGLYE